MIALSVVVALVTVLACTFAVAIHRMSFGHQQAYREDLSMNRFACSREKVRAARRAQVKAKPRVVTARQKPARPVAGSSRSLTLH
ncbi:hypothetical protein KX729_19585 [Rhizobium sp. XQZ8]|uniref:hypothetical protein n=1 Tax=Rhizobium populisoli TaxID=2859785 RepID=UPI001CA5E118|nr:hypothetical protein [Rhizobium populisoli]MBW6423664.1 hypothetical protein [Rhizobium populisoli]